MPNGYNGRILRVNLTDRSISVDKPSEDFYRTYYGGTGFIAYHLLKELEPGIDPLGPDNKLIFAPGVLQGAPFGGSGRSSVGAKSPLTGGIGFAEGGGFWQVELKQAGYDAVIVEGRADKPVYLWISDGKAEIRDAAHLWGKLAHEVVDAITSDHDDKNIKVCQCGIGGEELVKYACVSHDLTHFAGRSGMGAVMGSKKLRAIAVRGTQRLDFADRDRVMETARWLRDNWKETSGGLYDTGTAGGVEGLSASGGLPTYNFRQGHFDGAEKISGQTMRDTILIERDNCYACPIYCKRVVKTGEPYHVDPVYGGPEYETIAALGSLCGIDNLEAVAKANELCNAYVIDTISTGVSIAFAMECFEEGLLTRDDTGGIDLQFGNADAMLEVIHLIARREGIGELLAKGVEEAAEEIGGRAKDFAIHVKGQEVPMHEPRLKHGLGIGYAISPTGADHCHNIHDTIFTKSTRSLQPWGVLEPLPADDLSPQKIRMLHYVTNWRHFYNCGLVCNFTPWSPEQIVSLVSGVTGWNTTAFELMKVGQRAQTLCRVFNAREGFTTDDDYLTPRFLEEFDSGPLEGVAVPADRVEDGKQIFYSMQGWDRETGMPTVDGLEELNVGWAAQYLK